MGIDVHHLHLVKMLIFLTVDYKIPSSVCTLTNTILKSVFRFTSQYFDRQTEYSWECDLYQNEIAVNDICTLTVVSRQESLHLLFDSRYKIKLYADTIRKGDYLK